MFDTSIELYRQFDMSDKESKENKQWIWIAMDARSRQIIAFHVGDRSRESARKLWESLPESYRDKATFYTDDWQAYKGVIPVERHHVVKGKANHIERFNCTMRQRISRLVRKALSFSKKLKNHIGAIKYFICHYNLRSITCIALPTALHVAHYHVIYRSNQKQSHNN